MIYKTEKESVQDFINKEINERYIVIEGSASAHCCFEATVVDTEVGYWDDEYWNGSVCECFSVEDATLVCVSLNKGEII